MKKILIPILAVGALFFAPFLTIAAPTLSGYLDELKNTLDLDGTIHDIVWYDDVAYIAGEFTTANGTTTSNVVAFNTTTHTFTEFNHEFNGPVYALEIMDATGYINPLLAVGGGFTEVDESSTYGYLVLFDLGTGEIYQSFDPLSFNQGPIFELYSPDVSDPQSEIEQILFFGGENISVDGFDGDSIYGQLFVTTSFGEYADKVIGFDESEEGPAIFTLDGSRADDIMYAGGRFESVVQQLFSGEGAPFSESTFLPDSDFPAITTSGGGGGGETIYSAIPDGAGGWFIGGSFDTVDGDASYSGVAHIDSTGTVDESFQPQVTNFGTAGDVYALAYDATSSLLYIGGQFTAVNGVAKGAVAALNTADGTTAAFDPLLERFGSEGLTKVEDIELSPDGSTLYVAGEFDEVNNVVRYAFAALDTATGNEATLVLDGFGEFEVATEIELSGDGSTLYVGGDFNYCFNVTCFGGVQGTDYTSELIKADTAGTGTVASTTFVTIPDGAVYSMVLSPDETSLYIGGGFTNIDTFAPGDPLTFGRTGLAELDASDGSVEALNVPMGAGGILYADSMSISADGGTLYLGGAFTAVDNTPRESFAAIDIGTNTLTDFTYNFGDTVWVVSEPQDGKIFIGGGLDGLVGSVEQPMLTAIDIPPGGPYTRIDTFDAGFDLDSAESVNSLLLSDDGLYVGGEFSSVDGQPRKNLALVDAETGALDGDLTLEFYEIGVIEYCTDAITKVNAMALSHDGAVLYIGGCFNMTGEYGRPSLVGINTSDYSINVFNPRFENMDDPQVYALTLADDSSELYVGGNDGLSSSSTFAVFSEDGGEGQPPEECPIEDSEEGEWEPCNGGEEEEEEEPQGGGGDDDEDTGGSSSSGGKRRSTSNMSGLNIYQYLLAQIIELVQQIINLGGTVPDAALQLLNTSAPTSSCGFYRDLQVNDTGCDVSALQNLLIGRNTGPSAQALGAVGATGFFGELTRAAVAELQTAQGITPAAGYFGPLTRAFVGSL